MTTSTTPKKIKKGKKHISKHVLKAREAKDEAKNQQDEKVKTQTKAKKKSNKNIVKDPSEAISYLQQWKNDKTNWKFNKNTQSWIIRHMYDAEKLDKSAFSMVTEYLQGIQGGTAKTWALADATRRALRYKEFEKSQQNSDDTKEETNEGAEKKKNNKSSEVDDEDLIRWKKLSDHDKRKEYKRARKVMEVLKE